MAKHEVDEVMPLARDVSFMDSHGVRGRYETLPRRLARTKPGGPVGHACTTRCVGAERQRSAVGHDDGGVARQDLELLAAVVAEPLVAARTDGHGHDGVVPMLTSSQTARTWLAGDIVG